MSTHTNDLSTAAFNSILQAGQHLSTFILTDDDDPFELALPIIHHVVTVTPYAALKPLSSDNTTTTSSSALFIALSLITTQCLIICDKAGYDDICDARTFKNITLLANMNMKKLAELYSGTQIGYADKLTLYADFIRTAQANVHLVKRYMIPPQQESTIDFIKQYHESYSDVPKLDHIPFI